MTDNRIESHELVRAGSYLGPIILGALAGNAFYALLSGTKISLIPTMPTTPSLWTMRTALNVMFLLLGGYLVWVLRDSLARAGWAVFATGYAIRVLAPAGGSLTAYLLTATQTIFGILLLWAGVRQPPKIAFWIPTLVFLVVMGFVFALRSYADLLVGNRSVL